MAGDQQDLATILGGRRQIKNVEEIKEGMRLIDRREFEWTERDDGTPVLKTAPITNGPFTVTKVPDDGRYFSFSWDSGVCLTPRSMVKRAVEEGAIYRVDE